MVRKGRRTEGRGEGASVYIFTRFESINILQRMCVFIINEKRQKTLFSKHEALKQ